MLEVKENQMIHLKWIYQLKIVIFYSYVKLPEGKEPSGPRFAGLCQPAAVRGGHGLG